MDVNLTEMIPLLKREYPFQGLTEEQLAWIASLFQPIRLERETVVYSQGAQGDIFYMVFRGKVRAVVSEGGKDAYIDILSSGDYFGEDALLFDQARGETVTTIETTILLRMDREHFYMMLEAYPQVEKSLKSTAESLLLARAARFRWLGADEVVYFICRKHQIFLLTSLILPIFLGVAAVPVLSFGLAGVATPFIFVTAEIIGGLMLLGAVLWAIWNWIDWGNDFYVVTNQRVIWAEKVLGLYESRREAPLDTILAVNVTSSQIGRIVGYGTVNVRTYTGGISMNRVSQPYRFASFVEGFKQRAQEISKEEEEKAMQEALEQALTRSRLDIEQERLKIPQAPPPSPPPKPTKETRQVSLRERWQNFLKVRYEQDGAITYRKHWFRLFSRTWLPLLLTILLTSGSVTVLLADWFLAMPLYSTLAVIFIIGMIYFGMFLWLAYQYVDWRNDIYRLTPEQIHDIEKKPLGQEIKKTAPLESILSIEHERENILAIILNYGSVVINVGETRFTFDYVFNPDQVHQDVADYREALQRRKLEKEKARERERMINWLVTYYNQTEELEEYEE